MRKPSSIERLVKPRNITERILIVCEGEKTEPIYLKDLIRSLGINPQSAECSIIDSRAEGAGSAPRTIVAKAIECFEEDKDYDYVYCVFDRDNHETFDEACQRIKGKKLLKSNRKLAEFKAIYSIPRFEYWILLKFEKSTKFFNSKGDIERELKKYIENYNKDTTGIFGKYKNRILGDSGALINSKRCRDQVLRAASNNPLTYFDELVERIMKISKLSTKEIVEIWGKTDLNCNSKKIR